MDGRHQLPVLGDDPVPSRVERHGGADDRRFLAEPGGVDAEAPLALEADHALVVEP